VFPKQNPFFKYTHQLRSRYAETDQMGYVYYGRYLEFFEVARTEMIRTLGLPYRKLEEQGIMLPVIGAEVEYKAPVYYDQLMHIDVLLFTVPMVKLDTYYEVYTDRREPAKVRGRVSLCFMDAETRKPCRGPEDFIKTFHNLSEN
jgi:acyl-CoA thioester hydrolase